MGLLRINKREAKAVAAGLLFTSSCFRLGKLQLDFLRKIFAIWPDLKGEEWPELDE